MIHMSSRHLLASLLLVALPALTLCGCPRTDNHEEIQVTVTDEGGGEARQTPAQEQLLALARREGEVNVYTSMTGDPANAFAHKFEAKYPGVKVRLVREGTFDLVERVQREITTGQARAGGHGTAEYALVQDFLAALEAGRKPPLDEVRAMDLTVPGLIAHESAMSGGNWLDVPLV